MIMLANIKQFVLKVRFNLLDLFGAGCLINLVLDGEYALAATAVVVGTLGGFVWAMWDTRRK